MGDGKNCCKSARDKREDPLNSDVVIIGAGIAGAVVARELSKYKLRVVVVEKWTRSGLWGSQGNSFFYPLWPS